MLKTVVRVFLYLFVMAAVLGGVDLGFHLVNVANDFAVAGGVLLVMVSLAAGYIFFYNRFRRFFTAAAPVIALCALVLSSTGCYKIIPPGHAGITVQQTGTARGVSQIPVQTGRVFYNPFNEDVLDYPTFVQRAIWTASSTEGKKDADGKSPNEEISFQSKDSLHFTGDVAVAYQLLSDRVPHFYVQFRSDDLENFTHGFFRDAVRKAIGMAAQHYTQEDINGGRQADLEHEAEALVKAAMEPFGVNVIQLAFTSPPRPPEQVKQAIQAKVAAIQRAEQIENEKRQAVAEGEKTIASAEAQAKANAVITSSITPQLLQWRQLDVMQAKWNGQMPMVSGGNTPLIMQLPK